VSQPRRIEVNLVFHIGETRGDRDQVQSWRAPQGGSEDARDVDGPQVLVLDVDDALRAAQGLGVGPREAAFTQGAKGDRGRRVG
jgi:hypothetical protein